MVNQLPTPIPVSDLLVSVENNAVAILKEVVLKWIAVKFAGMLTGFWGFLLLKLVNFVFDKLVLPATQDLGTEVLAWIKKVELHKKVIKYENSQTNEEFDQAFTNLVSGSKFK